MLSKKKEIYLYPINREIKVAIKIDIVKNIIRQQENIDITIISDMEIHNLDDFLSYVASLPNVNRVHLFYTRSEKIGKIAKRLMHRENIAISPLHAKEDIGDIVGDLKQGLRAAQKG